MGGAPLTHRSADGSRFAPLGKPIGVLAIDEFADVAGADRVFLFYDLCNGRAEKSSLARRWSAVLALASTITDLLASHLSMLYC